MFEHLGAKYCTPNKVWVVSLFKSGIQVEHLNTHPEMLGFVAWPLTAWALEQVAGTVPLRTIKCHLQHKGASSVSNLPFRAYCHCPISGSHLTPG